VIFPKSVQWQQKNKYLKNVIKYTTNQSLGNAKFQKKSTLMDKKGRLIATSDYIAGY
jgi:hypothetical protein